MKRDVNVLVQRRLIVLYGRHELPAAFDDLVGDGFLAAIRVDRHDGTLEVQEVQQTGNRGALVRPEDPRDLQTTRSTTPSFAPRPSSRSPSVFSVPSTAGDHARSLTENTELRDRNYSGIRCDRPARKGDCYDNSVVESFNDKIKQELLHRQVMPTEET